MHSQIHPISLPGSSAHYQLTSFHFGQAGRGKKVYIQAGLHADEVPGMLVAQFLRAKLTVLEQRGALLGEVILVPAANPIGRSQAIHGAPFGRFDLATGVNFNRAYRHLADALKLALAGRLGQDASDNVALIRRLASSTLGQWQPCDDAEAMKKALLALAIDADIVLDLHCDNEAVLHLYAGTPLAEMVAPLAAMMQAHAVLLADAAGGEPFDEACSRLWWDLSTHFGAATPIPPACMALTLELRGERDVGDALAEQDARQILAFLALNGVIDAPVPAAPAARCMPTPLDGVEPLVAPHAGILVFHRALGERLAVGEVVAEVIDPVGGERTPVVAGVAGVFFARSAFRHILRGMQIGKIAGAQSFRSGKLLSQ